MSAWRVNQTVNMPIDQQPNELSSHTESVHIGQSPSGDESKKNSSQYSDELNFIDRGENNVNKPN